MPMARNSTSTGTPNRAENLLEAMPKQQHQAGQQNNLVD